MNLPAIFKNNHHKAIIALIIANVIWGAASPIFKLALQNISPFTLAFIRFFGAALILIPFVKSHFFIKKKDLFKIALIAFFGITINISFFFLGLQLAPSINAPIIASSGPVFLYIISIFLLHEKPHYKVFIGTIVSLLGILIVIGLPLLNQTINNDQLLGNLFFLVATLGAVGHAVVSKEILVSYKAITVTFWSFIIGSLTFLPLSIYEFATIHPLNNLDIRGVIGIIFGIFFSSAAAYTLYEWGIKQIDGQDIGIFTYIDPLAAIVIAIPLLGEKITPAFLFGSIFVFLGIFVAEGRLHYHPFHRLRR